MREIPVLFGRARTLAGIVTEPDGEAENHPAVLLLNAGLVPRYGPSRVYVRIARSLASAGFVVLRFDFSGVGDSERRTDGIPLEDAVLRETVEALEFLSETQGSTKFIAIGLCWGAENAFRIACHDPRVVAAVMLDWYAYRTFSYYLHHFGPRLFRLTPYYNFITGRSSAGRELRRILGVRQRPENPTEAYRTRQIPPKAAVIGDLRALAKRGIDLLFIYTGGQKDFYNYRKQFEDTFPFIRSYDRICVEYWSDSNHTFTLLRHQDALISMVHGFVHTVLERFDTAHVPAKGH